MNGLPAADDLIAAAKAKLGITSDHDLALRLFARYQITTSQSSISRYKHGLVDSGPPFDMTIALLDIAGWLNEDAVQAAALAAEGARATRQAEEAESQVAHGGSSRAPRRTA